MTWTSAVGFLCAGRTRSWWQQWETLSGQVAVNSHRHCETRAPWRVEDGQNSWYPVCVGTAAGGARAALPCLDKKAQERHDLNQEAMLHDNWVVRSSLVWPSVIAFVLCSSVLLLRGKEVLAAFIQSVQSQCLRGPWFFLPFFFFVKGI